MKKIEVSFGEVKDTTGYLFSFAKCLSAVLKCSKYKELSEDIVAFSGFAFRMWAEADLCPSAMSIWEFRKQKDWVENGGLICDYEERLWGEDEVEEERRLSAIEKIKRSIDNNVAVVAWDLGDCEWGIITGYDEEAQTLYILKIDGNEGSIQYNQLGRLEVPILSVLTIEGKRDKQIDDIIKDTKQLAVAHLRGEEWCDNSKGIAAYDTIIDFISSKLTADSVWALEYYLGNYAALKWYAWKFFEKYNEAECAKLYEKVHRLWQKAFDIKCSRNVLDETVGQEIIECLRAAKNEEIRFISL